MCVYFRERGREREIKRYVENHLSVPYMPPTRDGTCNLGMCPEWESNLQLFFFMYRVILQATEPPAKAILAIFIGINYMHIVVQPSPPAIHRTLLPANLKLCPQ